MFKLTRVVDYKGRVLLPSEVLNSSKIRPGDKVFFEISRNGSIIIRKDEPKKVENDGN